jgi:hypothetical protein
VTDSTPKPTQAQATLAVLQEIRDEIRELRDLVDLTTNGGFPLTRAVPTSELIAAMATVTAVLLRDTPIPAYDLAQRLQAAMLIAEQAVKTFDEYHSANTTIKLQSQLHE